ncbi:MAG: hypothetical protein Q7R50_07235 [Dehalococcoidales bacterium]|nr:hypothetical protein [Dehalococcoidales bacterium]
MWVLIVLAVLLSLIVLFVLSLCVPIDAVLEWDSTKLPRTRLRLVWLFGLVHFAPGRGTTAKAEPARKKNVRRMPGLTKMLKIITTEGLFGKVAALVKSSLRQIRIEKLEGDIRLELDDPADAGFVYAMLGAAYPIFRSTRLNQVRIEPVLGEEVVIRGNARAVIRLQPIRLVVPSLKFMFSHPAFSAMKTAIAG